MIRWRMVVAALVPPVDAALLVGLRPHWTTLLDALRAPHEWVAATGADRATLQLASALLWLVAAWLGVGILAMLVAATPGAIGDAGARLVGAVVPAAVQRLLAGGLGLGLLFTPLTVAFATSPAAAAATSTSTSTSASASASASATPRTAATTPAPTWPTDPSVPAPSWPTSPAPRQPAPTQPTPTQPAPPTPPTKSTTPAPAPSRPPAHGDASRQAVRPGDSLWLLAANRLGPRASQAQIAAAWPQWYSANRSVIGTNPDLLIPGQVLHVPASTPTESS